MVMNKHYLSQNDRIAGNRARWKDYQKQQLVCQECGKPFSVPPSVLKKGKGKYCSQVCANRAKGRAMSVERHLKANGYVYIKTWEHPKRSKQNLVAEHRLVVEKAIGRYLTDIEVVHHINGITTDNRLINLFLCKDDIEHRIIERFDKTFLTMFNAARYQYWVDFREFDIIKDRQDQLQEMVNLQLYALWISPYWVHDTFLFQFKWYLSPIPHFKALIISCAYQTMEQGWLAFVMKENYGKVWNGEDWVCV